MERNGLLIGLMSLTQQDEGLSTCSVSHVLANNNFVFQKGQPYFLIGIQGGVTISPIINSFRVFSSESILYHLD